MTVSPWTIYWITRMDGLKVTLVVASVLLGILFCVTLGMGTIAKYDKDFKDKSLSDKMLKWSRRLLAFFAGAVLAGTLVPSTKTAAAMVVVPALVNSEAGQRVQDLPDKLLQVLEIKIDSVIESNNGDQDGTSRTGSE